MEKLLNKFGKKHKIYENPKDDTTKIEKISYQETLKYLFLIQHEGGQSITNFV